MPRMIKLECLFEKGNGWTWTLPITSYNWYDKTTSPTTRLVLVGMNEPCDTPESVVDGVHEALYDHHQMTEKEYGFQDGDVIESDPVTINKYHSYNDKLGTVDVPAMRFRVEGIHVILEKPESQFRP